jgi:hypothetical protein
MREIAKSFYIETTMRGENQGGKTVGFSVFICFCSIAVSSLGGLLYTYRSSADNFCSKSVFFCTKKAFPKTKKSDRSAHSAKQTLFVLKSESRNYFAASAFLAITSTPL